MQVQVSQKICPSVLHALHQRFRGHVSEGKWVSAANCAIEFLRVIRLPLVEAGGQKVAQLHVIEEYVASIKAIGKFRSMEEKREIAKRAKEMLTKLKKT